ncbi:hypothetical protein K461DRAFT_287839 [Myriangium duriaei CBS 260.36]|uniref:RTA1 domain protein n=1 Tax=Myriangium duriaei CBS 260.36 TaxID=1168546 RepID=A0A9P4MHQ4_9PEZI|nr:hypothetical protein K461DRAFT_287839 [Myriangium duriaei CBS 260.36]
MAENGQAVPGSYFLYAPNKGAPVSFAIWFAMSMGWHFYQCITTRSWKITGLLPFIGLIFTIAFVTREIGAYHYDNLNVYLTSTICMYMAPPILELAHYHIFGRVCYYMPYCSPIHPGRTLTTFGALSSIVEILNGIGVAWTANARIESGMRKVALALLQASLIIQIAVIGFFVTMMVVFHLRARRNGVFPRNVQIPLYTLYFTTLLILIRCVYRTVEHFSNDGLGDKANIPYAQWSPLVRYEWFFYVFEASLMITIMYLWNALHPRNYLPENFHIYLARDGVSEVVGPGWTDNRSFFVTLFDPFGFFSNRPKDEKPFWETDGIEPKMRLKGIV